MERSSKTFYDIWWLTLPFAIGGIVALLLLNVRWVLDGGLRNWDGAAYLPFLAFGVGLALWALVPAALYLAAASAEDGRALRLIAAWQRSIEEMRDWLSLPVEVLLIGVRWGILIAAAAFGAWFLIAGDDTSFGDPDWLVPAAIRFALFLLLYLNFVILAGVVAGLWTLLRRESGNNERLDRAQQHSRGNEA